jgi:hypothetical protein
MFAGLMFLTVLMCVVGMFVCRRAANETHRRLTCAAVDAPLFGLVAVARGSISALYVTHITLIAANKEPRSVCLHFSFFSVYFSSPKQSVLCDRKEVSARARVPFHISNHMAIDFCKTWYEQYSPGGRSTSIFISCVQTVIKTCPTREFV